MDRNDFLRMNRRELLNVLRDGHPIAPDGIADAAYRGISLGLPAWVDRLAWKTFQKTFHRDPATGHLRGWNVRIEQRGYEAPSVALRKNGQPFCWGHYRVVTPAKPAPRIGRSRGLLIHYGLGGNAALDPTNRVRDPLVAITRDNPNMLLGWSYVDLGVLSFGTPTFFLLEREGPLTHIVRPPRHIP